MIYVKKGTGFTLVESSSILPVDVNTVIEAGMVVGLDAGGKVVPAGGEETTVEPIGFAINSSTASDVKASGAIGVYLFDGNSVICTDQFEGSVENYTVGAEVYLDKANPGKVSPSTSNGWAVGIVEDIENIKGLGVPPWETKTLIAIKLYSSPVLKTTS